jgi:hypothetical protein
MADPAPKGPIAGAAPTITAIAGGIITGAGFLPGHAVVVCINHVAEGTSDYLTYATDSAGQLHAELPTGAATGTLRIAATDHRTDPDGACGLLWSNTDLLRP